MPISDYKYIDQGCGYQANFLHSTIFPELSKYYVPIEYYVHVHIWQVNNCQIWMRLKGFKSYICQIQNITNGEMNEWCLSNSQSRLWLPTQAQQTQYWPISPISSNAIPIWWIFCFPIIPFLTTISPKIVIHAIHHRQQLVAIISLWFK